MIYQDPLWHMVFEVLDERSGLGKIGCAESSDGFHWKYRGIVLEEPFHLSYPYLVMAGAEIYMIPESGGHRVVRLYRANPFPTRWELVGTLLQGEFADSSLVFHRGRWWMFTTANPRRDESLCLFHSRRIEGPWTEHPRSPIVTSNPRLARSGGRIFESAGKLYRYAQDSSDSYGRAVWAVEVSELTRENYAEEIVGYWPILRRGRFGWNSLGMHHVDPHSLGVSGWIACVDGHRNALSINFPAKHLIDR
jgi:hypothetical protein